MPVHQIRINKLFPCPVGYFLYKNKIMVARQVGFVAYRWFPTTLRNFIYPVGRDCRNFFCHKLFVCKIRFYTN